MFHTICLDQVATTLIKAGADVNKTDEDGWTALMHVALYGYQSVRSNKSCRYIAECPYLMIHTYVSYHPPASDRQCTDQGGGRS